MSRAPRPQVVTGNALRSGRSVWLSEAGWTPHMAEAQVFGETEHAAAALARAQTQTGTVVGCYLADVQVTPQGPQPTHFREAFRRDGPSAAARVPG